MRDLLSLNFEEHFQLYENEIYRTVEGQYFITTRKLVDSDEEQRHLEEILDKSKPPTSTRNSRGKLHYLLYTPFRYPPLRSGSRFHTRLEQSIFYGSEELITSLAEVAYSRFSFMQHTEAVFKPTQIPFTHFVVKIKSSKAVLLSNEPFHKHRDKISHPTSYAYSQPLGLAMRRSGAEMFSYFSARAVQGINVGLFSPEAFQSNQPAPEKESNWSVYVSSETVEFHREHLADKRKEAHIFRKEDFYIDKSTQ